VKLYNFAAQKYEDVPEESVEKLVGAGSHQFAGNRIPVVFRDGGLGTIDRAEISEAFKQGFRYASPATSQQILQLNLAERKEELAKETLGQTGAFVAGALSGVTFGVSDVLLAANGLGEVREVAQEQFPLASASGTIGAGIGLLLSFMTRFRKKGFRGRVQGG
jgi:hypothetical protein